ncbi:Flp family type IVb pilin [uncultured Novosphingobium sp.]|uniref:Flp family type IVb pilin n=1 Tax=uncultured Novosphingobium sp. TaxID=292277 RepID=UPI001FA804A3|nr:Flp family type IVb pilin [uncultured Novosphingobium sp.]
MKALLHDSRGTSAVEYGLILGIVVLGIFLAVSGVASETLKMWTYVEAKAASAHQGG